MKIALVNDGLKRGLHESCKVLDKGQGRICFLAENCSEPEYKKLVRALCTTRKTDLIMVDTNTDLGEWCGLCKLNDDGTVKKAVKCAVAVITDYGAESAAKNVVEKYVESMQ